MGGKCCCMLEKRERKTGRCWFWKCGREEEKSKKKKKSRRPPLAERGGSIVVFRPQLLARPHLARDRLLPRFQDLFGLDAQRDGDARVLAEPPQRRAGAAGGDERGVDPDAGELAEGGAGLVLGRRGRRFRRRGRRRRRRGGGGGGGSVGGGGGGGGARRSPLGVVSRSASASVPSSSSSSDRELVAPQRPEAPRKHVARLLSLVLPHDLGEAVEAALLAREEERRRRRRRRRASGDRDSEALEQGALALPRGRLVRRGCLLRRLPRVLHLAETRERKRRGRGEGGQSRERKIDD